MADLKDCVNALRNGQRAFRAFEEAHRALDVLLNLEQVGRELEAKVAELRERALAEAAMLAAAGEQVAVAQAEAGGVVRSARAEADAVLEAARTSADAIVAGANTQAEKMAAQVASQKREFDRLGAELAALRDQAAEAEGRLANAREAMKKLIEA